MPANPAQCRFCLFRLELICRSPSGKLIGITEFISFLHGIQLNDRSVCKNVDISSADFYFFYCRFNLVEIFAYTQKIECLETVTFEKIEYLELRTESAVFGVIYIIKNNFRMTFFRYFGIQIPYSPGSRVTSVFQRFFGGFVVFFKNRKTNYRLALYFHNVFTIYFQRKRFYRQRLCGNVFTHNSVTPCRRAYKLSVFIGQTHRKSVKFIFDRIFGIGNDLSDTLVKGSQFTVSDALIETV